MRFFTLSHDDFILTKNDDFILSGISFHAGGYDSPDSFAQLDGKIKQFEGATSGNRLWVFMPIS